MERANETEQPELPSRTGFGVVITGSTKGVGLALAKEFLRMGDRVVVCSRRQSSVDETVQVLAERYGKDRVFGVSCDVSDAADVKVLGEFASSRLGLVDIWINNAGRNGGKIPLWEQTPENLATFAEVDKTEYPAEWGAVKQEQTTPPAIDQWHDTSQMMSEDDV